MNDVKIENSSEYRLIPGKCDRISRQFKGVNYIIWKSSQITIYANQSDIEQVYRDFCWDTDTEPGHETVILICDNFINITKCCPLGESFQEVPGSLICRKDEQKLPANLKLSGNSNINFLISNHSKFVSDQLMKLDENNFSISEDNVLKMNRTFYPNYCLEVLDLN